MDKSTHSLEVCGQTLALLPERAIYWKAKKTLIVADLHWGKSDTFRASGIPVPDALMEDDLHRLETLFQKWGVDRCLVLGDLIHGLRGLTPRLIQNIARFRQRSPVTMQVVRGNHDRNLREVPGEWRLQLLEGALEEGPFSFQHEPTPTEGKYVWAGHWHPQVRLSAYGDRLRLPCFYLGREVGVIPAFSAFTGGSLVSPVAGDRLFVVAENQVVEW